MKIINKSFIVILLALLSFACGHSKTETGKEGLNTTGQLKLLTLTAGNVGENIQLPGVLQPFQEVQIFPKVSGFIRTIYVDRGSVVKTGQVLMTLEAPEIEQHMSAAHLKYVESVSNLQTSKDKYKRLIETSKTPGKCPKCGMTLIKKS